ncbi:hypothetical protein FOXB_00076 [Fusarium oxysporum f. sp. conglutinans Fo5176]|uniref:LysM domain-containing protein n=1 Tax=Fusarium oxysporum (strain Fo5176) TaxID=660025 RepID=F9F102_FUSOF|nr:hypothetical protein FOXB_00076 [Fusarium oxysporum f. sp. conglutinans Fo5176]
MKAVPWLWYVSLARATCTSNYAIWISQDRAKLSETLGQALPKLDYDDISILNPGVDVGMAAVPGKRYKIPYHANMALIPPASWSDNCPKTLELHGAKSETLEVFHQPSSTPEGVSHNPSVSKLAQSPVHTEASGSGLIPRAASVTTAEVSKTVGTSVTIETRTKPHAATGTASSMLCWEETHPSVSDFVSSPASRIEFARSFCDRLQEATFDAAHPMQPLPYGDTLIGMQVLPSCPNHSIGAKDMDSCRRVLENINHKCPKAGGTYSNHCVLYYFVKR